MDTNKTRKHSELTSEQLFGLLANLPDMPAMMPMIDPAILSRECDGNAL